MLQTIELVLLRATRVLRTSKLAARTSGTPNMQDQTLVDVDIRDTSRKLGRGPRMKIDQRSIKGSNIATQSVSSRLREFGVIRGSYLFQMQELLSRAPDCQRSKSEYSQRTADEFTGLPTVYVSRLQ